MQEDIISAEVEPISGMENRGALVFQRLGFRILHIGHTISVQGPKSLWTSIFAVSFAVQTKRQLADVDGSEITYQRAQTDQMTIPPELQDLIDGLVFVEPPEFM